MKKNKCAKHARVMGNDPDNRVPTGQRHGSGRHFGHGWIQHPNMHLIQHMHPFTGGRLGVIPSKRANGTVLVRCKVEEVGVLGTFVVEVGVHDDGRGTHDLGGGSCSCT